LTLRFVDSGDVSDTTFAYNDHSKLTDTWDKHFVATTAKHAGYAYDQAGLLRSTTYPDNTQINRTSTWNGRIDTLSRSGSLLLKPPKLRPNTHDEPLTTQSCPTKAEPPKLIADR